MGAETGGPWGIVGYPANLKLSLDSVRDPASKHEVERERGRKPTSISGFYLHVFIYIYAYIYV